jgi:ABC-type phosphate transport system auxiliary subunit
LIVELKKEINRSELIRGLLNEYYQKGKPLVEVKKALIEKKDVIEKEIGVLNKEISLDEKNKQIEKDLDLKAQSKAELNKFEERRQKHIAILRDAFLRYEINKEDLEALFKEFLDMLDNNKIRNIVEFMMIKKINKKERYKQ